MKNLVFYSFYLFFFFFTYNAFAQPGSLDNTFGTGGKVTTPVGSSWDYGRSVAIQSDGKIVAAGYSDNGANDDFAIVRYNSDGTLDATFGGGDGIQTTAIGSSYDMGYSVAIQSDGKTVVAGRSHNGANMDFAIVRYNTDGTLDNTFGGGDGIQTTDFGGSDDLGYSVAIQSDGKIIVAGAFGGNADFAIVRYNSDGTLDATFGGGDGIQTTAIGSANDYGRSVAIQSDGKMVVAGYSDNGATYVFAIVCYNSDGTLDNSFGGGDGIQTTAIGSSGDLGRSVAIQSDGKMVVAGYSYNGANEDFAIVRYDTNGTLDNTFGGGDGIQTTDIEGSSSDWGYSVAIQSDGKIVVAGTSVIGSTWVFAIVRYNSDGTLDTVFGGGNGIQTTAIGGNNSDWGYSVAIQSDGKIVVAGVSYNGTDYDFAVVRYNGACTPISSSQSPTICLGDSVTVGSNTYTADGTYMDTLTAANGCDSIVTTNLTVLPNSSSSQSPTICQGDSVTVGSNTYTANGTYIDALTAANGCDSIVTTNLTVDSTYSVTINTTINNGDSIMVGNSVYTTTGTYIDTLAASNGCDSIVTTNLTVLTGISTVAEQNIKVAIYPNPFSHKAIIEISGSRWTKGVILIYDVLGQTVHKQNLAGKLETLNLQLPGGIYFYQLKSEGETVPINRDGKIMVADFTEK